MKCQFHPAGRSATHTGLVAAAMNESWAEYCRREQATLGLYWRIKGTLLAALTADQTHSPGQTPPAAGRATAAMAELTQYLAGI
jgi:hypothetical protein